MEKDKLLKLNLSDLKKLCKEKDIKGYSSKTKDVIIEMVLKNQNDLESVSQTKNIQILDDSKLKMIDLFAGTGAFSLAFENTNKVQVILANDFCENSEKIYNENFSHKLICKDMHELNTKSYIKCDIITAGWSCQSWSIAGKQLGFEDDRANTFWKIMEFLEVHNPKVLIIENVKNLLSHDDGKSFEVVKSNIEKRGYFVKYKVLNTSELTGIPQHRERVYIVCFKEKKHFDSFEFDFPIVEKKSIKDFLENEVQSKYYYNDTSSTWTLLKDAVKSKETVYQYRRVYVRENKSNECPTLTANMGTGGHNVPIILDNKGIRKLTPRECFNFQGFPKTYKLPQLSDGALYKLAGNAVSVPIVNLLANKIVPLII
jgi:DNA (cytosine-5)-methyltransferase 1